MTNHSNPAIDPHEPLDTDERLLQTLDLLLGGANRRQTWMLVLGEDKRLLDPLMPMEGLPDSPDEIVETEDLGPAPFARVLAARAAMFCDLLDGAELVLVWERCGADRFTRGDRAWAGAFAEHTRAHGPRVRAQFVLHDSGIRPITADDWG